MAYTNTFTQYFGSDAEPVQKTAVVREYRNSRGDRAQITKVDGAYDVRSRYYGNRGIKTLKSAFRELVENSAPGCRDWKEWGPDA